MKLGTHRTLDQQEEVELYEAIEAHVSDFLSWHKPRRDSGYAHRAEYDRVKAIAARADGMKTFNSATKLLITALPTIAKVHLAEGDINVYSGVGGGHRNFVGVGVDFVYKRRTQAR